MRVMLGCFMNLQIHCGAARRSKLWFSRISGFTIWLKASTRVEVERMIGVYSGEQRYHFDGLDVLPVCEFLAELYAGKIF